MSRARRQQKRRARRWRLRRVYSEYSERRGVEWFLRDGVTLKCTTLRDALAGFGVPFSVLRVEPVPRFVWHTQRRYGAPLPLAHHFIRSY